MDLPNAADRKSIRRQEKAARLAERQREEVLTALMSTMAGRAYMWDLLSSAHIFHSTHVAGDALASAFQEGRRSIGLAILSDILRACPDQYILAMRESNERHNSDDRSPTRTTTDDSASERLGGPLGDGGDSGALADQALGTEADGGEAFDRTFASPGKDIYV